MPEPVQSPKPRYTIRNWRITSSGGNKYLYGRVFDHPYISEGEVAISSAIIRIDLDTRECETHSSVFTLQEPFTVEPRHVPNTKHSRCVFCGVLCDGNQPSICEARIETE